MLLSAIEVFHKDEIFCIALLLECFSEFLNSDGVTDLFLLLRGSFLKGENLKMLGCMERTNHFVLSIWNPKQLKLIGKDSTLSPTVFVPYLWQSTFLLFILPFIIFKLLFHCVCYNPE